MTDDSRPPPRPDRFKSAIAAFIAERREAKLKGNDDDIGASPRFEYTPWLADAARRVGQIQAVTHVLKATHPDARGSSLHVAPVDLPARTEIGSHLLGDHYAADVVGNAAALDVFKFLKIEVDGKRLLDWMQHGDTDLQAALSDDADLARSWMTAFAALERFDSRPATHPMAKQVYWLVDEDPQDDSHYHLLQPMFASSLAHTVHADIQEARFGDVNKEARLAWRERRPSGLAYRDYPQLVARKLGGTKPQNISQLNSERRGLNYLLASLPPPAWKSQRSPNLHRQDSAMAAFTGFGNVRGLIRELSRLLLSDTAATMETRNQRETVEQGIGAELAMFGVEVRATYPAGWTREAGSHLPRCEQLWLDPDRVLLPDREEPQHPEWTTDDQDFRAEYERGEWANEVAERFGRWLNQRLRDKGLPTLATAEMRHWARQAILNVSWPLPMQRKALELLA